MTPPSKWLFFPTPASASGYLQEITWNMSGANRVSAVSSISSTGRDIVSVNRTRGLAWADGVPRFFNGTDCLSEAGTSQDASGEFCTFSSAADCRTWWDNFVVSMRVNSNAFQGETIDPIIGSCQAVYINPSGNGQYDIQDHGAFQSGDTVQIRITAAS
jgi:hypothetical protein